MNILKRVTVFYLAVLTVVFAGVPIFTQAQETIDDSQTSEEYAVEGVQLFVDEINFGTGT